MYYFIQLFCILLIFVKFDSVRTLNCYYYNNTCEGNAQCINHEEQEDCSETSTHCFVLWSISSNGSSTVKLKGCFQQGSDCLDERECVDRGKVRNKNMLFCCCKGELCNKDFAWSPTPVVVTTETNEHFVKQDETVTYMAYVVFPLSLLLLVVIMIFLKKRKSNYFIKCVSKPVPTMDTFSSPSTIVKFPHSIELKEIIANGKFGAVQRAVMDRIEIVAVKKVPIQEKQSWVTEQEVYSLPLMDHDNILRFIGAEKHEHEFWLITAYHELGSLQHFLKNNTVTWDQLCHIAYTMARGLMYLHEEIPSRDMKLYKPAVAHRDFKSSNVLLKSDLTACIADFGLALVFRPSKSCGDTHGQVGTRRYMAPEILEGAINFSRDAFLRIDMYACGLVLWELASRCSVVDPVPAYKLPFEKEVGTHPTLEAVQDVVVHQKLRPLIPPVWRNHPRMSILCDTITECWDHDAEARLSASCVCERVSW